VTQLHTVQLARNAHGRLTLRMDDGSLHEGITPVRAFPVAAPLEGISLVGQDGKEVYWVEHLDSLAAGQRALLEEEFAVREFIPVIERIETIDAISVPSVWTVWTDKGRSFLSLKAEEDIRKLEAAHHLLITSREGMQYRIRDVRELDKTSQKFLERFL
jgi:hypothetical protein